MEELRDQLIDILDIILIAEEEYPTLQFNRLRDELDDAIEDINNKLN